VYIIATVAKLFIEISNVALFFSLHTTSPWLTFRWLGSNILVDNKACVKLGDFGLARTLNNDAQYTKNVVTLWYRAPELLLGERKYDAAIDMWSVGYGVVLLIDAQAFLMKHSCVFAEMLTRKPLFPGATDIQQLELIFQVGISARFFPHLSGFVMNSFVGHRLKLPGKITQAFQDS
jgi:serine/threonine protein kinase